MIGTDTDDAKIMGIYGMGGIGKTTLAKLVYDKIYLDFANCCFLADVRKYSHSKGFGWLQTQLISKLSNTAHLSDINCIDEGIRTIEERFSSKKVLILLDDVDEKIQLTALLGRRGCFGPGSRILITTRNANVLRAFGVELTYLVGGLDPDRSLQLFSKHVFRRDHPPIEKMEQSKEIVKIAEGLLLILEVMGSTLSRYAQKEEMWDEYLLKWKNGDIEGIGSKLMMSYEVLDSSQRQIFLDIACLFDGYEKSTVICMWRDCGFCPTESLEVLELMSLIKIGEDNKLWMHDQLKDFGREIISRESGGELDKQSRLWNHKDALDMLLREKTNAKLEALRLQFGDWSEYRFTLEGFAALPNLRFLQVDSHYNAVKHYFSEARLLWHNKSFIMSPTDSLSSENQLLPNLRWLSWHHFPWRILQLSNFSLHNLVILEFSGSKITHNWHGWRHIKRAERLKVLDLSDCTKLTETPDFSGLHTLERLILRGCYNLAEIGSSIGQLKRLVFLDMINCEKLCCLPKELGGLPALTELLLACTSIREIPDWWGMVSLENPRVPISPAARAVNSFNRLSSLTTLSLDGSPITHLPESIGLLTSLKKLSLRMCSQIHRLPSSIKELRSLTELDLYRTKLIELPDSMESLENLKALKLSFSEISVMSALPKLPESLTSLVIRNLTPMAILDLSNLINLKLLLLSITEVPAKPGQSKSVQVPTSWCIGRLSRLEVLTLQHTTITNLSLAFSAFPHLMTLRLLDCRALECISQIPSSVTKLHIGGCPSLTPLDISYLKNLSELYVIDSPLENLSRRELPDNLLRGKVCQDNGFNSKCILMRMTRELHGILL